MTNGLGRKLLLAATALSGLLAHAQEPPGPLESRLAARKVVMDGRRETLVDASDARPGDVIEYVATYRNTGTVPLRGVAATLPVPRETVFVPGSARPANALATVDGESFFAVPLGRVVRRADGAEAREPVPIGDYRALRWQAGDLAPGQVARFSARVRVVDDRPAGAGGDPRSAAK